jgi:nitrite reductase/ring-hydroxylating ferredoxin subunit
VAASLDCVAVYRRALPVSLERIRENVLDWEHLPWLHRESFSRIACEKEGPEGFRARVGLPPAAGGAEILLELALETDARRYVARTLAGPGSGTEIWTRLRPVSARRTDIEVEFHLPDVPAAKRDAVGAAYVQLYTRLWDQDESMMTRRENVLAGRSAPAAPGGVRLALGPLASLRARLPFTLEHGGREWRIAEIEGALVAFSALCPHRLGPLGEAPVEDGHVRCPWHGYRFDVRTGLCESAGRLRLAPAPRVVVDPGSGEVELRF